MEQTPATGPTTTRQPHTAGRHIDAAPAEADPRETAADRRDRAWQQLSSAVAIAVFLFVYITALRDDGVESATVLLFGFLLWTQLSAGVARRPGRPQPRRAPQHPLRVVAAVAVLLPALGLFGAAVFVDDAPLVLRLAPSAVVLLGLGGYGIALLRSSRSAAPRTRPVPVRLRGTARVGTILVGVALALGAVTATAAGFLGHVLSLATMIGFLVWMLAFSSEIGLPAVGAAWRWPHLLSLVLAEGALIAVVLLPVSAPIGAIVGVGILLVFVGASFAPGR
ncbi:hypothetical protein [Microbacterium sp. 179-I 3D4 NHS]|uniref:hypothetical protein n=1 Tax=Microbacterium sp. 179-I 3D4 NHS TaxID=3142381 RepID=UPI0039A1A28E